MTRLISDGSGRTMRPRYSSVSHWVRHNQYNVNAWFPLDDWVSGGTMKDRLHGRNGTWGATSAASSLEGVAATDFSNVSAVDGGGSLVDDGAWDFINGIFCVARFDAASTGDEDVLITRRGQFEAVNGQAWSMDRLSDKLRFFCRAAGAYPVLTGTSTLSAGKTYTLGAGTIGSTVKLYVNGVDDAATGGAPTFETGSNGIGIGAPITNNAGVGAGVNMEGRMVHAVFLNAATPHMFWELHNAWLAERR